MARLRVLLEKAGIDPERARKAVNQYLRMEQGPWRGTDTQKMAQFVDRIDRLSPEEAVRLTGVNKSREPSGTATASRTPGEGGGSPAGAKAPAARRPRVPKASAPPKAIKASTTPIEVAEAVKQLELQAKPELAVSMSSKSVHPSTYRVSSRTSVEDPAAIARYTESLGIPQRASVGEKQGFQDALRQGLRERPHSPEFMEMHQKLAQALSGELTPEHRAILTDVYQDMTAALEEQGRLQQQFTRPPSWMQEDMIPTRSSPVSVTPDRKAAITDATRKGIREILPDLAQRIEKGEQISLEEATKAYETAKTSPQPQASLAVEDNAWKAFENEFPRRSSANLADPRYTASIERSPSRSQKMHALQNKRALEGLLGKGPQEPLSRPLARPVTQPSAAIFDLTIPKGRPSGMVPTGQSGPITDPMTPMGAPEQTPIPMGGRVARGVTSPNFPELPPDVATPLGEQNWGSGVPEQGPAFPPSSASSPPPKMPGVAPGQLGSQMSLAPAEYPKPSMGPGAEGFRVNLMGRAPKPSPPMTGGVRSPPSAPARPVPPIPGMTAPSPIQGFGLKPGMPLPETPIPAPVPTPTPGRVMSPGGASQPIGTGLGGIKGGLGLGGGILANMALGKAVEGVPILDDVYQMVNDVGDMVLGGVGSAMSNVGNLLPRQLGETGTQYAARKAQWEALATQNPYSGIKTPSTPNVEPFPEEQQQEIPELGTREQALAPKPQFPTPGPMGEVPEEIDPIEVLKTIAKNESKEDYSQINPNDPGIGPQKGSHGKYQVLQENLTGIHRSGRQMKTYPALQYLGGPVSPEVFRASPEMQEKLAQAWMTDLAKKAKAKGLSGRAAEAWMARAWNGGEDWERNARKNPETAAMLDKYEAAYWQTKGLPDKPGMRRSTGPVAAKTGVSPSMGKVLGEQALADIRARPPATATEPSRDKPQMTVERPVEEMSPEARYRMDRQNRQSQLDIQEEMGLNGVSPEYLEQLQKRFRF